MQDYFSQSSRHCCRSVLGPKCLYTLTLTLTLKNPNPHPNYNANAIPILHLHNAHYVKIAQNCANTTSIAK